MFRNMRRTHRLPWIRRSIPFPCHPVRLRLFPAQLVGQRYRSAGPELQRRLVARGVSRPRCRRALPECLRPSRCPAQRLRREPALMLLARLQCPALQRRLPRVRRLARLPRWRDPPRLLWEPRGPHRVLSQGWNGFRCRQLRLRVGRGLCPRMGSAICNRALLLYPVGRPCQLLPGRPELQVGMDSRCAWRPGQRGLRVDTGSRWVCRRERREVAVGTGRWGCRSVRGWFRRGCGRRVGVGRARRGRRGGSRRG